MPGGAVAQGRRIVRHFLRAKAAGKGKFMQYRENSGSKRVRGLRLLLVWAAATATLGCASMKAYTADDYDRGGATSEKYYKDSRACDKQSEAHGKEYGYGPYDPTAGAYNHMYDACMRSSGYTRKKPAE